MADPAKPADVAFDRNIVGRIREDHLGFFAIHERRNDRRIKRITTYEPMGPKLPKIARLAARRNRIQVRESIVSRIAGLRRRKAIYQLVDFSHRKAREA